jgi:hypothetical protein
MINVTLKRNSLEFPRPLSDWTRPWFQGLSTHRVTTALAYFDPTGLGEAYLDASRFSSSFSFNNSS